jgi:hypothetical protein
MAIPTVSIQSRWQRSQLAETDASDLASAHCYRRSENIGIGAVVIAELKFRDVQRQIFLADFVECAHHATLKDRPETLNRIRVDRTNDILAHMTTSAVVDCLMRETVLPTQPMIASEIISAKQADFAGNRFLDETFERADTNVINDAGYDIALPLHGPNDRDLAASTASVSVGSFVPMTIGIFAADIGLIDLDNAAELGFWLDESRADFVAHGMRGAIASKAHDALDLQGTDALLAGQHQMDDAKPLPQRLICVLEDGAGNVREAIGSHGSAFIALPVERPSSQRKRISAAARACDAIRPATGNEICLAGILTREGHFELGEGHLMDWLGAAAAHGITSQCERNIAWPI